MGVISDKQAATKRQLDRARGYNNTFKPAKVYNKTVPAKPVSTPTIVEEKPEELVETNLVPVVEKKQEAAVVAKNQVPAVSVSKWNSLSSYDEAAKVDPNLTRAGWMHEHAKWRTENNMPEMSYTELVRGMGMGDPYKTKAEEEAEQKKVKRASVLNALGDVFLNLWNVGRTQAGNPAMEFTGVGERGRARVEQMRQGYDKLAKQNYNAYMEAYVRDKAARDAIAAEKRKTEAAATLEATKHKNALELEGVKAGNAQTAQEQKQEDQKELIELRGQVNNKKTTSGGGSKGSNSYLEVVGPDGKKRRFSRENGADWVTQAYRYMLSASGGEKSPYRITDALGNDGTLTNQKMYDAVTRHNNAVEATNELSQYKRGGGGAAPLE